MKFERTDEMIEKMTIDSFGSDVQMDVDVHIEYSRNKLKAYAPKLVAYLQFPRKLRKLHANFVCDAVESTNNGRTFYRAYKGSIRDEDNNVVG